MAEQDQPKGAQPNADVAEGFGGERGKEYDAAREQRAKELENASEQLGDSRELRPGAVVSGTAPLTSVETLYPGAELRGLADDAVSGGVAARAAKGLDTGDITTEDGSWTAQSALPYVSSNAEDVPGQTFTVDELPDPRVVDASILPSHTIPADLVVDAVKTDNLNTSQERGGDAGTAPAKDDNSERATQGARVKAPAAK
jgi:hypothetical protein